MFTGITKSTVIFRHPEFVISRRVFDEKENPSPIPVHLARLFLKLFIKTSEYFVLKNKEHFISLSVFSWKLWLNGTNKILFSINVLMLWWLYLVVWNNQFVINQHQLGWGEGSCVTNICKEYKTNSFTKLNAVCNEGISSAHFWSIEDLCDWHGKSFD